MVPADHNTAPRSRKLAGAASVVSAACAAAWMVPIFGRDGGFFGHYTFGQLVLGTVLLWASGALWHQFAVNPARRRRIAFRWAGVGVGLATGVVLVEVVYVAVRPDPVNPFYRVDPRWNLADDELGFVRKPNLRWEGRSYDAPGAHHVVYRTDANGFRNSPEIRRADIAFIGDSFTEAGNVREEDTFVRRVGRELNRTCVNLGRSYYGPQQELAVLRRYALHYEPKDIVWVLFEGNDLIDAERYRQGHVQGVDDGIAAPRAGWVESLLSWRLLRRFREAPTANRDGVEPLWFLAGPDGAQQRVDFALTYVPGAVTLMPMAWEDTKACIAGGLKLCRERGIKLTVAILPIKFRVYGPFVRVVTEQGEFVGPKPEDLTRGDDLGPALARFCGEIGCRLVDPQGALLAAAGRGERVYSLRYDTHLDVAGHRIVAEEIAALLRESGPVAPRKTGRKPDSRLPPPG